MVGLDHRLRDADAEVVLVEEVGGWEPAFGGAEVSAPAAVVGVPFGSGFTAVEAQAGLAPLVLFVWVDLGSAGRVAPLLGERVELGDRRVQRADDLLDAVAVGAGRVRRRGELLDDGESDGCEDLAGGLVDLG